MSEQDAGPLQAQVDLANRIRGRWGQDWHKADRDPDTYLSAHNDVLDLVDTIDALQARIATLQARIATLTAELADAMGECIDFTISYGLGDEDRYRARYRELTGKDYRP